MKGASLFAGVFTPNSDAGGDAAEADYGRARARLLLMPSLSGLAVIGGVYLTALLTDFSNSALGQAALGQVARPAGMLQAAFDLNHNRTGLLTPRFSA
jgi:hypothetical protein